MDGVTLQARIYKGYAIAAKKIGLPYSLYRPLTANAPLGNLINSINAAFSATPDYKFSKPNEYGDPVWVALLDDSTTITGDYVIGNNEMYFIAGKQFLTPVLAIECNRTVKVIRYLEETAFGAVDYSAEVPSKEVEILGTTGAYWPASILFGGKSQKGVNLPADTKQAGWRVLLPPSVPVVLQYADIIVDDLGRRYVIEASELTDLGWRIAAVEQHT